MPRDKLWKLLLKRFKFSLLFLFFFAFLISYLPFLIRFNLRTNLYKWEYRGKFYYLFSNFSVTKQITNGKIHVDWTKLLLILFLLYFPLKIIFHLTFNYFCKYYQRKFQVYLTKKLLSFAAKNRELIAQKSSEKVHILNQTVPEFSRQFFILPLKLFEILVDLGLEFFSLIFLIRSNHLIQLIPLTVTFLLVNLIWLVLFYFFTQKWQKLNKQKKRNYQEEEKLQIRIFCENINYGMVSGKIPTKTFPLNNQPPNLEKLYNLLDENSPKFSTSFLLSELTELPDLIIPGIVTFFLLFYYHFQLGGNGDLGWESYFLAYNLQRILTRGKKVFYWLSQTSNFRQNYGRIEEFFD